MVDRQGVAVFLGQLGYRNHVGVTSLGRSMRHLHLAPNSACGVKLGKSFAGGCQERDAPQLRADPIPRMPLMLVVCAVQWFVAGKARSLKAHGSAVGPSWERRLTAEPG